MSINTITAVRVYTKGMNYETFKRTRIWIIEIYGGLIHKYRMEKGNKKRFDEIRISVEPQIMMEFFEKIYDFVRTAEFYGTIIDDCEHQVTLYYGPVHKEVFKETAVKGSMDLIGLIEDFVRKNGGQSDDD